MAASLSAYWVKFFKGAGFPLDVATKHAVVFSNNRIKPDMLPDLDKPSLKEMGITLMGDMIAILRYAKKVVEETTCERFLVDSEDVLPAPKAPAKPVAKKVKEIGNKTVVLMGSKADSVKKIVKPVSTTKKILTVRKPISPPVTANAVSPKQGSLKRKLVSEEAYEDNDEDNWNNLEKKVKVVTNGSEDSAVEYTITAPKATTVRTQILKKPAEQKRTVFDRLGDSSVTSTTNLADTTPTFNITVGKDVFKRSTSVFKRLGDIDDKKDHATTAGILKNGSGTVSLSGILKNRTLPSTRTSVITTKRVVPKITGTMHADHEASKKITLNSTSRILKLKKAAVAPSNIKLSAKGVAVKPAVSSGKLASERLISIPAKARLGTTTAKQVTFSKVATVSPVKKPDVFSRLGM
ncbi:PREDICTED: uncharacterized protein C19orf47 [Vollenhovia emeryi]|uniref:uncharacterized protein C19orf47 n=1 Tax=Vollenhovia emeryi TaxID=411798 RepID=UPI0005F3B1BF|nr:PREDICTED: uncharacterized protein C19orf47 [Vollenhovia emeryi]